MIIVNKPEERKKTYDEWYKVQCYKCKSVFRVHPMNDRNSPFIINCELHKSGKCNDN